MSWRKEEALRLGVPEQVFALLDSLTDEQRELTFRSYCKECGSKELPCYCTRDD